MLSCVINVVILLISINAVRFLSYFAVNGRDSLTVKYSMLYVYSMFYFLISTCA